jgi:hypothetical protein
LERNSFRYYERLLLPKLFTAARGKPSIKRHLVWSCPPESASMYYSENELTVSGITYRLIPFIVTEQQDRGWRRVRGARG